MLSDRSRANDTLGALFPEGIARNPGAAGGVRAAMLLGLVFVETLTLFTFVVGILLYLKL